MTYRIKDGRCEGILSDGRVVKFDDAEEMLACAKIREELFKLVGRPIKNMDEIKELINSPQQVKQMKTKKKKVRIRIDPKVEHVGNKKALA